jgi:DNA-binding transcriptional ArsR family regulator
LIIAQNAKNDENKKTIFGSTYFQYYSRNIFELKRSNDTFSQDETRVALFHQESNYSERYKPMGFHLSFARDSIKVESEPVNYAEFLEKIDRQQQVLELLNLGKKNANDISRELNISKANTYMTLSRLKEKGKVIKLADDNWQLKIEERYNDVPLS